MKEEPYDKPLCTPDGISRTGIRRTKTYYLESYIGVLVMGCRFVFAYLHASRAGRQERGRGVFRIP